MLLGLETVRVFFLFYKGILKLRGFSLVFSCNLKLERFTDFIKLFFERLKVYSLLSLSYIIFFALFGWLELSYWSTERFLSKDSSSLSFSSYLSVTPNLLCFGKLLLLLKKRGFCAIFLFKIRCSLMNCAMFLLCRLYPNAYTCRPAQQFFETELLHDYASIEESDNACWLFFRSDLYLCRSSNIITVPE